MKVFELLFFFFFLGALVLTATACNRQPIVGAPADKSVRRDKVTRIRPQHSKVHDPRRKPFDHSDNFLKAPKYATVSFGSSTRSSLFNPVVCQACKAAVEVLRYHVKTGREEKMYSLVENACILFNIQSSAVCSGIAHLFGPEIVPILNSTVNSLVICSYLLTQECTKVEVPVWDTPLPPKPVREVRTHTPPPPNGPRLKVLHITDTHYDSSYTEGAKSNCGEPLCCHVQNGMAGKDEKKAGKWGDWNCDIPERTLDSMLEHASRKNPDLDYIIWTGDIPAHDIWKQTRQSNLAILDSTVEKIKRHFPNVPVYAAVGNHEAAPTDIFPPPGASKSVSWLYEELDRQWRTWLPANTSETIKTGAFYTVLIRPGLRLVSLNTNYCYHRNWWLMLNSTDPAGQLEWLVKVLRKAEENNEKVQIIAHIAPGQSDCLPTWRDNYYRIVSRFRNTITNQFYGHSHKDEFELYYDERNENEVVGVGFLGPSVTTYVNLNPGYRIYFVDGDRDNSSRAVLDYENWILDLERSNKINEAKWSRSYVAKDEYRMKSLLPNEWNDLFERMKVNENLFQLYYRHSHKDSPQINVFACDDECKKAVFCNIKSCKKYG